MRVRKRRRKAAHQRSRLSVVKETTTLSAHRKAMNHLLSDLSSHACQRATHARTSARLSHHREPEQHPSSDLEERCMAGGCEVKLNREEANSFESIGDVGRTLDSEPVKVAGREPRRI